MIHPSYFELMEMVNKDVPEGEKPIITSRYSIVLGTAKRARQLVAADHTMYNGKAEKPLSIAVDELKNGEIHIIRPEAEEIIPEEEEVEYAVEFPEEELEADEDEEPGEEEIGEEVPSGED